MLVTASAPGKLFLLGEYAVLHGAPALLSAVDVRVRLRLTSRASWWVSAPQLGLERYPLAPDGSIPAGADGGTRAALAMFDAARAASAAVFDLPPMGVEIDSGAFYGESGKLGLGASAAVSAALCGGFAVAAGARREARAQLSERAILAHRAAQDGAGSGADVAACVYGGTIAYRSGEPPRRLRWPSGLQLLAVATGAGADTRQLLKQVADLEARDPAGHRQLIARLAGLAEAGAAALADFEPRRLLPVFNDYFDALDALGAAAGAAIVTPTHHRLRRLAAEAGGAFKPTGAGGPDAAIVAFDSRRALAACAAAFAEAGYPPLDLRFAAGPTHVTRSARLRR